MKYSILAIILFFCSFTTGTFAQTTGGIGATLKLDTTQNGTTLPQIQSILPGSPAAARKLQAGWYIVSVNGQPCQNKSLEDVVGGIRGAEGTTVKLEIADNPQAKKTIEYTLVRATIQTNNAPLPDPKDAFVQVCEQDVKLLKRNGHSIAKAVSSNCGDYYFSFDATEGNYTVKLLALAPTNSISAVVYDSRTESVTTALVPQNTNNATTTTLTANVAMTPNSAGVVSVIVKEPNTNCKGMYIIVYK